MTTMPLAAALKARGARETRLTTMLGYLVALDSKKFCRLFGFSGIPRSVSLETRHAEDRGSPIE
jgi:hypothetical protein